MFYRNKPKNLTCAATIFLIFFLAACGSMGETKWTPPPGGNKTRPDPVAERSIVLLYTKANEKVSARYYHDGAYDKRAMISIERLMRDRQTGEAHIDPELIDFLVDIRTRLGLPPTVPFEILSGFRSKESNEALAQRLRGVAKESLHCQGWAVDFRVPAVNGSAIAEIAKTMQRGGVTFYPDDNHVHVDLGKIRTWKPRT